MQIDVFHDFTKKNIILWLGDIWIFVRTPRDFIRAASARSADKIFSQFLFYFIIYTASYLLLLNSSDFNSAIKPSVMNIILALPIIPYFGIIARIISKRFNLKEIFLFVMMANLTIAPFEIALLTLYMNSESQVYLIMYSLLHLVLVAYIFYGFGFIVQESFWKGVGMVLLSIAISSLFYLSIELIKFENNFQQLESTDNDSVFQEYKELFSNVQYEPTIPIKMSVMRGKVVVATYYGIQNIYASSTMDFTPDSIKRFKDITRSNIAALKIGIPKLKFQRNISFFQVLLEYYTSIDAEVDSNYLNAKLDYVDAHVINNKVPGVKFKQNIDFKANVGTTAYVQMYNNQIIKLNRLNESITVLHEVFPFLAGRILSNLLYPECRRYPTEPFLKLDH
jgi:hypothetical protein